MIRREIIDKYFGDKEITLTSFSFGGIKIVDFMKYLLQKGLKLKDRWFYLMGDTEFPIIEDSQNIGDSFVDASGRDWKSFYKESEAQLKNFRNLSKEKVEALEDPKKHQQNTKDFG